MRSSTQGAPLDTCYYIFKLINDGNDSKDYWSLRHWSTVGETAYGLRSAWIKGTRPTGTTWQNWTDWDLGTDRNANCSSTYIDVTFIITVGANFDACETWDMTKSANGSNVSYKMEWKCNCWPWMGEVDREVAYSILVNVSQGATPRWTLGMGMAA
ncbi:MAG: hypothetical protein M3451_13140 [Chloroflexota bacterium]|nr:hypothetical protein [Chloroflexota bacterium]